MLLNNDGNYGIYEALGPHGTDLVMGKIDNDRMPAGHLRVGKLNRLLLWVKGDRAAVYLNGRLLGAGGTTLADAPSAADLTAVPGGAFAGGSGDSAVVKLVHFYIFHAA
ncbi:MAG: hypothetical protein M3082_16610 [Candidatus Dormibacteraeota bacterium]|nr:hypothetical protein [Candidatus Dormibacteraeota bacterium]